MFAPLIKGERGIYHLLGIARTRDVLTQIPRSPFIKGANAISFRHIRPITLFFAQRDGTMRRQQLREIINGGESLTVEFKRKFTSEVKIAKEIVAFANSIGGYLLVGVDDDKTVVGVKSEKEEIGFIETVCSYYIEPPIEPAIEVVNIEYRDVVVVRIEESDTKPHRITVDVDGKRLEKIHERPVYVREGSATLHASKEVVKVLEASNDDAEGVTLSIGKHEKRLFEYLEQTNKITAKEFAHIANISERRAIRLLIRLVKIGLVRLYSHEKVEYYTLVG